MRLRDTQPEYTYNSLGNGSKKVIQEEGIHTRGGHTYKRRAYIQEEGAHTHARVKKEHTKRT
jgi:hypothetical protein